MKGILYVVSTPIGNLNDITLRALSVLQESDFIVAESRQHSLKLLTHFNIKKQIVPISSYTEEKRSRAIIEQLLRGRQAALVSSAGTPCISDPGIILIRKCYEAGIEVKAIPGPSAVLAALSISGMIVDRFLFYGFLPLKKGKKTKILRDLLVLPYPAVLFESPRRVAETLEVIGQLAPDRFVAVAREITKVYEEVVRGPVEEVRETLNNQDYRGEFTIIVEGSRR
jgi:16S rRNA (cytidine1402-2'-O)-methyltransferase